MTLLPSSPGRRFAWMRRNIVLGDNPISFAGRPYLRGVYDSGSDRVVLKCARQVEKTTLLGNLALHRAVAFPGSTTLFVTPRREQALLFARSRLQATLLASPLVRRQLLGRRSRRLPLMNLRFGNNSEIVLRAAYHSADAVRGISAHCLMVDEYQDIAPGDLPVLEETLSHAERPFVVLSGTPKLLSNQLEMAYERSTAKEWRVRCAECHTENRLDERCLGPEGVICASCQGSLNPATGFWRAMHPEASWADGYWISHLMTPWTLRNYGKILEKQETYDPVRFKNEILGLSTTMGEMVLTREELMACAGQRRMARGVTSVVGIDRPHLVLGIDWGAGGAASTVFVVAHADRHGVFQVIYLERLRGVEEAQVVVARAAALAASFRVQRIAADGGGNGVVLNQLLRERLPGSLPVWGIRYGVSSGEPQWEGTMGRWTVDRTAAIGGLIASIKKRRVAWPRWEEFEPFAGDFLALIADYDDAIRRVTYTHPEHLRDDAVHAVTYAHLCAYRLSEGTSHHLEVAGTF